MSEYNSQESGAEKSALPGIKATVYPSRAPGQLLAQAKVELGGIFVINNIRIMDSRNGPFMSMPRFRGGDGQFHDVCYPITAELRNALRDSVMSEFERVTDRTSMRGTFQKTTTETPSHPAPEMEQRRNDKGR